MPFKKGTSGNPGGRPKGTAGLCAMVRHETHDGQELVLNALKIVRGEYVGAKPSDVLAAIRLLIEYAYGKPVGQEDHKGPMSLGSLLDELQQQGKVRVLINGGPVNSGPIGIRG